MHNTAEASFESVLYFLEPTAGEIVDQPLPVVRSAEINELWQEHIGDPHRRLALAVLVQAIEDLQKCSHVVHPRELHLYRAAVRWVAADDRDWPYSFANLCELFDICPQALRRRLLAAGATQAQQRPAFGSGSIGSRKGRWRRLGRLGRLESTQR